MAAHRHQPAPTPEPTGPVRYAAELAYFSSPHSADLKLFRCEPYTATLSTKGCASRWIEAQSATGERADQFAACRGCSFGAGHAGHVSVSYGRYFGALICPRCREGRGRMIGGTRCVGCYNREREASAGKNARGNVPIKILADRVLRTLDLTAIIDGHATRLQSRDVVDPFEPMMQVLRTTKGRVEFAFTGPVRELRQQSLFIGSGAGRLRPVRPKTPRRPLAYAPSTQMAFCWASEQASEAA